MKWTEVELNYLKNVLRAVDKMKCGDDMLGVEARALGRAVDFLNSFIEVASVPPQKIDEPKDWGVHKPPVKEMTNGTDKKPKKKREPPARTGKTKSSKTKRP
jgi:hypothetical protein